MAGHEGGVAGKVQARLGFQHAQAFGVGFHLFSQRGLLALKTLGVLGDDHDQHAQRKGGEEHAETEHELADVHAATSAILMAQRSLAERARGLARNSSSPGVIGFDFTIFKDGAFSLAALGR